MERDQIERMRALVAQTRARRTELLNQEFTAQSEDQHISVTVDGSGKLTGLQLNPRVFRNPDSEGLAARIIEQYEAAYGQANEAWETSEGQPDDGPAAQREAGRQLREAVLDSEARGESIP